MNRKLKAFTLMELLFTLALSGVLLALGMSSFRIFLSFYQKYDQQVDHSYEAMIFKDRLSLDMDKAYLFEHYKEAGEDQLHLYDKEGESFCSYSFQEDYILRDNYAAALDSFHLKTAISFSDERSISIRDQELSLEYIFSLNKQAKTQDQNPSFSAAP